MGTTEVGGVRAPGRPDPAGARIAAGMIGVAATSAIVAAIVGGTSAATVAAADPVATLPGVAAADVPVRHVTRVVHLPSDATPPPRKVVYATPVPAPSKPRVVVVTTTQSGTVIP